MVVRFPSPQTFHQRGGERWLIISGSWLQGLIKTCLAWCQGDEMYPGLFHDLYLDMNNHQDTVATKEQ